MRMRKLSHMFLGTQPTAMHALVLARQCRRHPPVVPSWMFVFTAPVGAVCCLSAERVTVSNIQIVVCMFDTSAEPPSGNVMSGENKKCQRRAPDWMVDGVVCWFVGVGAHNVPSCTYISTIKCVGAGGSASAGDMIFVLLCCQTHIHI